MAKKKNIHSKMGRPLRGCLSTYTELLRRRIRKLRKKGRKWGPDKLRVELLERYDYEEAELPSRASLARFLKADGWIAPKSTKSDLPEPKPLPVTAVHDVWELDAQGATPVNGLVISMINIKDMKSKVHCAALPVLVRNTRSQPRLVDYQWALRFAFEEFGLPKQIQVDKDSVFIDTQSRSPFPRNFQLWLIGMGVEVLFIKLPPPQRQAMVERSHQTLDGWVFCQQDLLSWLQIWEETQRNRQQYNEKYPVRTLQKRAPMEAFPEAKCNERTYSINQEHRDWCRRKVDDFLTTGQWFRKVASSKTISLGGEIYYLPKAVAQQEVSITYLKGDQKFEVKCAVNNLRWRIAPKGLSTEELSGGNQEELIKIYKAFKSSSGYPVGTTL